MSEGEVTAVKTKTGRPWLRPVLLLAAVVIIMLLSWQFGMGQKIGGLQGRIESFGPWGPLVFILLYIGATVAALPGTVLTVVAGVIFDPVLGVVYVSIASTAGATLAFLIGRYFARRSVEQWLGASERFRRLDELTEEHGQIIVAITRLILIVPFNFQNYAYGLTRVKLGTYVLWSWLAMLPMTVVFVVGTGAITTAVKEKRVPWALVIAVASIIVLLTFLVRQARRRLKAAEEGATGAGGKGARGD